MHRQCNIFLKKNYTNNVKKKKSLIIYEFLSVYDYESSKNEANKKPVAIRPKLVHSLKLMIHSPNAPNHLDA